MLIDVSHRDGIATHSKGDYINLYEKCLFNLKPISEISSIILCGSLAKDDIIEGWSDIDIIIFIREISNTSILEKIKNVIQIAKEGYSIGLGIDIVYENDFIKSQRFGGRPLMMTYEVAKYGIVSHGCDFLSSLTYDKAASSAVDFERKQLIAAEIHSWRRQYIHGFDSVLQAFFNSTKALLRILQCEVGPNLELPINSAQNLERFKLLYPSHPQIYAFESAIEIRRNWLEYYNDIVSTQSLLPILNDALMAYSIFYEIS